MSKINSNANLGLLQKQAMNCRRKIEMCQCSSRLGPLVSIEIREYLRKMEVLFVQSKLLNVKKQVNAMIQFLLHVKI